MAAITDESAVLGLNKFTESLKLLTTNTVYQGEMRSKITHRGQYYQQFSDVMVANGDANEIVELEGSIIECYRFFGNKVHVWVAKQIENIQYAAESLSAVLLIIFRVVVIYLKPKEREHKIFETLDARGEPLTEWDKIKNYLLYKAGMEYGVNQEKFFVDNLEGPDNEINDNDQTIGNAELRLTSEYCV